VVGLMLISNAASLTVIASGLRRGQAPIYGSSHRSVGAVRR
jgi:multisubunit Na+/H+ antiporter MnhC subunit